MGTCVSCGVKNLQFSHDYKYRSTQFRSLFPDLKVMKCGDCSLFQVDHSTLSIDKLNDYYRNLYRKQVGIAAADSKWQHDILLARGRALSTCAIRHLSADQVSKIFEVGAGYGVNLMEFGKLYDKSELLTDEIGKAMISNGISRSSIDQGPFDIVLMSHVLEHFIDPKTWIVEVARNLRKGGLLIVEVPNEGRDYIYQASFDLQFHEPHITFFQPSTLKDFFSKNFASEFELEQVSSAGEKIAVAQRARESSKPGKFLSFCLRQVRKYGFIETIARKTYSGLIYLTNKPDIDFSDDCDFLDRVYLRLVLRKT